MKKIFSVFLLVAMLMSCVGAAEADEMYRDKSYTGYDIDIGAYCWEYYGGGMTTIYDVRPTVVSVEVNHTYYYNPYGSNVHVTDYIDDTSYAELCIDNARGGTSYITRTNHTVVIYVGYADDIDTDTGYIDYSWDLEAVY